MSGRGVSGGRSTDRERGVAVARVGTGGRVRPRSLSLSADEVQRLRREVLESGLRAGGLDADELSRVVGQHSSLRGTTGAMHVADQVHAELHGLGPLQALLADPGVTDILVNAPGQVWTDGARGLQRVGVHLGSEENVRSLASRLIAAGGRRLDDGSPCVDVTLSKYRVHAVIPPVSGSATLLSIRVNRPAGMRFAELEALGMFSPRSSRMLQAMVAAKLNFLISGATGTGKTTVLGALLELCEERERIVVVEDATELRPRHPHCVSLQTRRANVEGSGEIRLDDLVRQALRMRPDRLVVGEVRGAEILDLLTAMNTGHQGAGASVHANSAEAVPARLAALGALARLSHEALTLQVASAIDVLVHIERGSGTRRVGTIAAIGLVDGALRVETALRWDGAREEVGPAWGILARRCGLAGE